MHLSRSLALSALAALALTGVAFAHAKMTSSVPADGASVPPGLSQIELGFSHPMRLTLVRVHRAGGDADVPLQGALPKAFADDATVSINALTAGAYSVSWTAVSKDGHVMKGSFSFKVAPPPAQ
jgi:methionine-rich copper-binding protein CopC